MFSRYIIVQLTYQLHTYIARIESLFDGTVVVGSWSGVTRIGVQIDDEGFIRVPHGGDQYLIVFSVPALKAIESYELTEGTEPSFSRWFRFTCNQLVVSRADNYPTNHDYIRFAAGVLRVLHLLAAFRKRCYCLSIFTCERSYAG